MLQGFSWQQFLLAALVLTLLWYVVVLLVFYRGFLLGLFSGGGSAVQGLPKVRMVNEFRKGGAPDYTAGAAVGRLEEEGLMGAAKLPKGMSLVGAADFSFVGDDGLDREAQVGLVPDVLEELKGIFSWLAANDGNKRDFLERMRVLVEDYPKLSSHPGIGRLKVYVAEHVPFHLSAEELEELWG